jgi:DNA-binding CsgD family transcriptional regulator
MRRRKQEPDGLTPREWQVLALIRQGLTNEEIAEQLGISFGTAKYHVAEIISKLGAEDRHDAVRLADEKHAAPLVLPWLLFGEVRVPRPGWRALALASAAFVATGVALLLVLGGGAKPSVQVYDESAGLDIAQETLDAVAAARQQTEFKQTLLLSHGEPQNVGTQRELIASLPRVSTLGELQALVTPEVKVIVVDASAEGELVGTDFLREQWEAGRAIVGINLCFADLPEEWRSGGSPGYSGVITEIAPDGTTRYFDKTNQPEQVGRCKWAYDLADAGYPYISYLQPPPDLEEMNELRSLGLPAVRAGGSMGRLDLSDEFRCYVRDLLAFLDNGSPGHYQPQECS